MFILREWHNGTKNKGNIFLRVSLSSFGGYDMVNGL
jgi:hypothetical protein